MKQYDISFVIIEYHCLDDVKNCFHSIQEKCKESSYEIIVTSNSTYHAEKRKEIIGWFPGIQWIFNEDNLGFARAMNAGILRAAGKIVVVTNPDVTLRHGHMAAAYRYLMSHPDIGLMGPKIVDKQERIQDSCRRFMTPKRLLSRVLGRLLLRQDVLLRSDFDYERVQPVDWVVGAFMMVNKSAMEKVGLLDEGYFLYIEDMDWCKRFWDKGYKVIYYPDLLIEYKGSKRSTSPLISGEILNKYSIYHLKSYLRFLAKNRSLILH